MDTSGLESMDQELVIPIIGFLEKDELFVSCESQPVGDRMFLWSMRNQLECGGQSGIQQFNRSAAFCCCQRAIITLKSFGVSLFLQSFHMLLMSKPFVFDRKVEILRISVLQITQYLCGNPLNHSRRLERGGGRIEYLRKSRARQLALIGSVERIVSVGGVHSM